MKFLSDICFILYIWVLVLVSVNYIEGTRTQPETITQPIEFSTEETPKLYILSPTRDAKS